jgi:hypothetical protein
MKHTNNTSLCEPKTYLFVLVVLHPYPTLIRFAPFCMKVLGVDRDRRLGCNSVGVLGGEPSNLRVLIYH